jgi:hypothetical protein
MVRLLPVLLYHVEQGSKIDGADEPERAPRID